MAQFTELRRVGYLPDRIADQVMERISSGELKPGDTLPTETSLAEMFGVSRNAVREAIARLRSDGVVSTKQGRGAVVNPTSERNTFRVEISALSHGENLKELFELRGILEIEATVLAAERRTDAHLTTLAKALAAMGGAGGFDEARLEADAMFHRVLGQASANDYLATIISYLSSRLKDTTRATHEIYADRDLLEVTIQEHRQIYDAVRDGDVEAARTAMKTHIHGAATRLGVNLP